MKAVCYGHHLRIFLGGSASADHPLQSLQCDLANVGFGSGADLSEQAPRCPLRAGSGRSVAFAGARTVYRQYTRYKMGGLRDRPPKLGPRTLAMRISPSGPLRGVSLGTASARLPATTSMWSVFVSNASCLNFRLEQRELASARQTVSDIGQRSITPSEAVSYRRTL